MTQTANAPARKKMSLRPSGGFALMMGGVLLFFLYTKASRLSLPDVRLWALHHLYGIELVAATLLLALTVVVIWQVRRLGRLREKGRGAVVVADMDLGKIGGVASMKVPVSLTLDDLRHHAHFLGATGSGKTVTLENIFRGFVLNRWAGGVFVDPKDGKAIASLMQTLPAGAKDRIVLIRPDDDQVVGLNPLEVLPGESEELIADQAVAILRRVLRRTGGDNAWGGRMDVVASIGVRTLMKHPGSTLCDLPALLGPDDDARRHWTKGLKDPFVLEPFWADYDPKRQGVESVVARLQGLFARPSIRAMLGQPKSTINLGQLLDTGHIVLVDIPKGRVGEDSMALLGSFIVARLWQVTQRRADNLHTRPVCVVLDEFQNFVDEHLTEILTESRAYNVGWLLANQFMHQLPVAVQHAVESCALTKMRLTGSDDKHVYHAKLRRRLFPDQEADVVLRPPADSLGAAHAEQLADHALQQHGTPRQDVEEYLLKRLGRAGAAPEPQDGPGDLDDPETGLQGRPGLTKEQLARLRARTYELIWLGKVRPRPKECENCGEVPTRGFVQMHHWDYDDPADIAWLCPTCHLDADRGRRAQEDPANVRGFTDERVRAMLDLRRQGQSWQAIADGVGLSYRQARGLCERRFPDDPVWKRRVKTSARGAGS